MRTPSLLSHTPNLHNADVVFKEVVEACTHPPEARWPAIVALLAVAGVYMALPSQLMIHHHWGPRWLLSALVVVLLIPTIISFRLGRNDLNQIFGYTVLGVVTFAEVWSLGALILVLPTHGGTAQTILSPGQLLRSALSLWIANIVIFALWYWRLDAGGPHVRDQKYTHERGAFLFPQMTLDPEQKAAFGLTHWRPKFADYLFLAFNHSTAFSPTDTAILSRWAKLLVMAQASVSLATLAILAARAVNIL